MSAPRPPRRVLARTMIGATTAVNTMLLGWLLWRLWQTTTAMEAVRWAWCVVGSLSIYAHTALATTKPRRTQS